MKGSDRKNLKIATYAQAWESGPGPRTKREFFIFYSKAFTMGIADLIPGVSGGTIAFISGIYEDILGAVSSLSRQVLKDLLALRLRSACAQIHLRVLFPLLLGVLSAIFSLAHLMHYLIREYPTPTWAIFFGLICGSIAIIWSQLENPRAPMNLFFLLFGILFAYVVVSLIPVSTPEFSWFIFCCGMIGACAMILPGISGSFLMLILGKYELLTGAVKNPFEGGGRNLEILFFFGMGAGFGLLGFSKLLNFLLNRYHCMTMAFLTGVLIGSLKKVWPWKEVLETTMIRGKVRILREANVMPSTFDFEVALALSLMVTGIVAILILEHFQKRGRGR